MSTEKTIFKKIIDGEIPADIIHEDEYCLAFPDIAPQAPTHLLVIPKKELGSLSSLTADDQVMIGHIMLTIAKLAEQLELDSYRVVTNCGVSAGQSVFHLHFHLLGGREMKWPPG